MFKYLSHYIFKFLFKTNTICFLSLTPFHHLPYLLYLKCKFYFLSLFALSLFHTLIIAPPSTFSKSFFFQLIISYTFLLSYSSLNFFTHLLILAHLLLIVWLWVGSYFCGWGYVSWAIGVCSGRTCITAHKMWWAEWLSASQREGPPKDDPATTKTQLHPETQHK